MNGHGQKLSRNQEKAIAALLVHPSIPAAAKAIKVGESTLSRWLKISSFQAAYRSARKQVVSFAIAKMQTAMMEAVDTLKTVMNDPEAPASTRVAAARTILDLGVKSLEIEDFEERIKILEIMVEGKNLWLD